MADELDLLLEENYQRDLIARTMMFAAQKFDCFDFSDPSSSVFFALVDDILVDLTVTDYPGGGRIGHVNVKERGATVLEAEMDLRPNGERPSIKEYTGGNWEQKIPIPEGWVTTHWVV